MSRVDRSNDGALKSRQVTVLIRDEEFSCKVEEGRRAFGRAYGDNLPGLVVNILDVFSSSSCGRCAML